MTPEKDSQTSNRREVLKGLGVGALALPATMGSAGARSGGTNIGNLHISNVEIGWEDIGGGWEPAGNSIDSDQAVDVKVDISGLSGNSQFVSMVVPGGPNGELAYPHLKRVTDLSTGGSMAYTHGGGVGNAFKPDDLFGSWPEGRWRFYVSAFENDGNRNAHGVGMSGDIYIR